MGHPMDWEHDPQLTEQDREMINKAIWDAVKVGFDTLKSGGTVRATSQPNEKYRITITMPNPAVEQFDVVVEEN